MNVSFGLSFIDGFGNNNLLNDTIQSLPAILSVSWFDNGNFSIIVKDKNANIVTEHHGTAEKGSNQFWDLKLTLKSEIWHIHVLFESSDSGTKEDITKILKIDPKNISRVDEEFPVPQMDDVSDFDEKHRFKELDAHWMKIDPDKNLFRFVYNDFDKPIQDETIEWYTPILLIHGFKANHLTWNSLVSHIWMDGFRNIFSTEILDPTQLEENLTYLESITEFMFELTGLKKIIIIAHSIGAWITKFFIKKSGHEPLLFVSIASPHYGLFKGLKSSIYLMMGKFQKNSSQDDTELFFQQQNGYSTNNSNTHISVNINGSVLALGGSDGVFKPQIVPEMINFIFNKNHQSLNKCEETDRVVSDLLLKKAQIYELRLVSIQPNKKAKKKSFNFTIKSKSPMDNQKNNFDQVYPRQGYLDLEENQAFKPEKPIVIFTSYVTEKDQAELTFEIYTKIHTLDKKENLVIPLAKKEFIRKDVIIETKNNYTITLESLSYKLEFNMLE